MINANKLKIYMLGEHQSISPLTYQTYIEDVNEKFYRVYNIEECDAVVCSYGFDLQDDSPETINLLNQINSLDKPIIILCEEPLWDTICEGHKLYNCSTYKQKIKLDTGIELEIYLLNHITSNIFKYDKIPHFLTTNKHLIDHYKVKSASLNHQSRDARLINFNKRTLDVSGLFTMIDNEFHGYVASDQFPVLYKYRTDLAKNIEKTKLKCTFSGTDWLLGNVGTSIYETESRHTGLWHDEKLKYHSYKSKFCFAVENTIASDYFTEKVLDAIACYSIPIMSVPKKSKWYNKVKGFNILEYDMEKLITDPQYIEDELNNLLEHHEHILEHNLNYLNEWLALDRYQSTDVQCLQEIKTRIEKIYTYISNIVTDHGTTSSNSIVTACMNREKMLNISLSSWLNCKSVDEIIIVDWNSTNSLEHLEDVDKRIKVIRYTDKDVFNIGKAYDTGIRNATGDNILKMDVDFILNPYYDLDTHLQLKSGTFLTGHFKDGSIDNETGFLSYLNGFIYLRRQDYLDSGGYDGYEGYGWDDDSLYCKLIQNGLERETINFHNGIIIYHNPHDDTSRVENYHVNDVKKSLESNQERWWNSQDEAVATSYHKLIEEA